MYHCLGLAKMQAQLLGYGSVMDLAKQQHSHMMPLSEHDDEWYYLISKLTSALQPYLPQHTKLNLEGAGAFLDHTNNNFNKLPTEAGEAHMAVLKARYEFKQTMRLDGVLQGVVDFCDSIFGITVVEDAVCKQEGWNKNVRLLHLYQQQKEESDKGSDHHGDNSSNENNPGIFLGSIYLDPFADAYFRTEDAEELVTTRLFSRSIHQTVAPVVVMALKIRHSWDDAPIPISWDDTRDLLYHFGMSLQLILEQLFFDVLHTTGALLCWHNTDQVLFSFTPMLCLRQFMEMWIQNDGFLNRLAQLSETDEPLDEDALKLLREELQREKALEIVNTIFLSELQREVFEEFDPRGDETLVALQARLAKQHLPKGNLPSSSDLSPLLAVFQEQGSEQHMSAYSSLWSELLSAMAYETFQNTDLRDTEE
ncbi:MAG: hypothetical protein SGARI_005392, partial [Bacillariaceae sp.]